LLKWFWDSSQRGGIFSPKAEMELVNGRMSAQVVHAKYITMKIIMTRSTREQWSSKRMAPVSREGTHFLLFQMMGRISMSGKESCKATK
jgi:hypothetical protein